MRDERMLKLGRVLIDGDLLEFEREAALELDATRRDVVNIGVGYEYREATEDKEAAHVRLTAQLDGHPAQSIDAHIGDNPLLDDSRRGFVSVPVHGVKSGVLTGRYVIEVAYGAGPWTKGTQTQARLREEGTFTLRVT